MVLAGPDGKIHAFIEGYLEAERLDEQLKRAITASTTTGLGGPRLRAGRARRSRSATTRVRSRCSRASRRTSGEKPIGLKAKQILDDVEKARGRRARAREGTRTARASRRRPSMRSRKP